MHVTRHFGNTVAAYLGIGALSLVTATVIGWLASQGNPLVYLVAVLPIALLAFLFLAARPTWLLWGAIVGGLVISGLLQLYVPKLQAARWALSPIAITLAFYGLLALTTARPDDRSEATPTVIWWAIAFLCAVLLASVSSPFLADRFIIGFKGYFQVWGLLVGLAFIRWPPGVIDRLPRLFLAIAFVQLPFVAHQLFFLVPARVGIGQGIVPIDIVSGTFGASLEGGGANAVLNAYLMIVIAGLISARQLNVLTTERLLLLSIPLAIPLFVNEAKVSVVYMLVVYIVLFGKDLIHRPIRFLWASLAASALLVAMLVAFMLGAPSSSRVESIPDLIRFTYQYNVADDEAGTTLSRFGALRFWLQHHGPVDIKGTLFGHGIGFSRVGDTETPYRETAESTQAGIPLQIDLTQKIGITAVSGLLWETGVVGLLCIIGLLAATYRSAHRLEKIFPNMPERVAALRAVRVAAVIIFVILWHKSVFVFHVAYQTLVMILIGYVAYWERNAAQAKTAMQPAVVTSTDHQSSNQDT